MCVLLTTTIGAIARFLLFETHPYLQHIVTVLTESSRGRLRLCRRRKFSL